MKHRFFILGLFILGLVGCKDDTNPLIGTWHGTITAHELQSLDIDRSLEGDKLVITFGEKYASLNGHEIKISYNKNLDAHFIYELGTSRTMSAFFDTKDRITLKIPGHYRQKILSFNLERAPPDPTKN